MPKYPDVCLNKTKQVAESIAVFIEAEIQDMDILLRMPYRMLQSFFYFLPIIIYGRPFNLLSLEKKRNYIYKWENSKITALKDFIKLFRYLIILCFYDHPCVQEIIGINRGKYRQDAISKRLALVKNKS